MSNTYLPDLLVDVVGNSVERLLKIYVCMYSILPVPTLLYSTYITGASYLGRC